MIDPGKNAINDCVDRCVQRFQAGEGNALDEIYDYLVQFCLRVIAKTCGKYIDSGDEEAAIIPDVILNVLDKYASDRGPFMMYLGQAVKNRTIDELRRKKRKPGLVLFRTETEFLATEIETVFFEDIIDDIARKQEIKTLTQLLAKFDLTFGMLADGSPRQARTREEAQRAALIIAQDQELSSYLTTKGMLPHKILEEQYHLNRNILDRYRKYIIAAVLIHINDLGYLKPYVVPQPRRGEKWLETKA